MSIPYYNVTRSHQLLSPLIFFRCSIFYSMQNSKHVLRGSEHYYRDILIRFKQPRKAFSVAKLDGNSSGSQGVPRQKDAKPLLTSMFYSVENRLTKSKNYLWKLHFYPGNWNASPTRRYEVYKTILQALSWTQKKAKHQFLFNSRTACKLPWGFWHHSMSVIPSIYFCIGLIAVILNITMFGGCFRHLHHLGHLPPHLSKPAQVHGFDLDHPAISQCPAARASAPSGRIVASGIMSLSLSLSLSLAASSAVPPRSIFPNFFGFWHPDVVDFFFLWIRLTLHYISLLLDFIEDTTALWSTMNQS